jgi:FAD/FMN-containing dehydrogenase
VGGAVASRDVPFPPTLPAFLDVAREVVGERHVITDPDVTAGYVVDWTGRWRGSSPAVVRPGETAEVAAIVAAARRHGVVLVPQGGNTGLVGGGVPLAGEIVVSTSRLDHVGEVDRLAAQVTAGAGATLAVVQRRAAAAGLAFGVDLGARGVATIGGMVATNAGGLHVVRHGAMRAQVVGVEAVLGTGDVVSRLGGLVKDNTGYDLAQLLCGSEGTLGIVTAARLRLVPDPPHVTVALLATTTVAGAVALAAHLRASAGGIQALEMMVGDSLRLVVDHLGVGWPVRRDAGAYLLVETAGSHDPTPALATAVDEGPEDGRVEVVGTAVATERPDRDRLWALREGHPEAAAAQGVVHKIDVTLPAAGIAPFCTAVESLVAERWPGATLLLYGHVGDGNVHVNVVGPAGDDHTVADAVLGLVVSAGGSISAEHGIGRAKRAWLMRDRSAAEVAAMRALKKALDPDRVLNPHALLPPG